MGKVKSPEIFQINYQGCRIHRGNPHLWRKGDSRQCSRYKNAYQQSAINGADHEVNGSTPLTPKELLFLRRSWLSSNKLVDLQAWVMTLLAVKLFLRDSELSGSDSDNNPTGLQISSFVPAISIVSPNGLVEALGVRIKGKSDNAFKNLMLWKDDENPELCPILHLLLYVHMIGIKDGHLFPTHKELSNVPGHRLVKTHLMDNLPTMNICIDSCSHQTSLCPGTL